MRRALPDFETDEVYGGCAGVVAPVYRPESGKSLSLLDNKTDRSAFIVMDFELKVRALLVGR